MTCARTPTLKLILTVSVVLRVGAVLYLGNSVASLPGTADQVSYHNLALRVLDGHGFTFGEAWWPATPADAPTAHWSYLYTLYLVTVYAVFGPAPIAARLIQAIAVGLLQPYLAYRIVKEIGGFSQSGVETREGEGVALVAAGITAVYVYFVYYAAALMTEAFYLTAILASCALAFTLSKRLSEPSYRKWAMRLGVALGVTVLLRQLFLLFIPFLFLWVIVFNFKRENRSRTVTALGVTAVILIASILPITLFNYTRFDRFVLLNTNAGYAFFLANHPIYGTQFVAAREMDDVYQQLIPPELRHLNEAELDQALLKEGLGFVIEDPVRYIRLSLSRIPAYFKFWPESESSTVSNFSRVGSFGLFLPFMIYGVLRPFISIRGPSGAVELARPSAPVILLYLFIIIYTAIHILSWAQVRYRLPVDAVLTLFAALAVFELGGVVLRRIQRRSSPW